MDVLLLLGNVGKAFEEFRRFQRWLEKHDWFFRKLYRAHVKPPETCEGYGSIVYHPC